MPNLICPYCQHEFTADSACDTAGLTCPQCGEKFQIYLPGDADNAAGKFRRSNIILLAINAVVTVFCICYALYLWNFRREINQDIQQKKHEQHLEQSIDRCRKKISDYGNFMLEYAKNNNGELPDKEKCRDEYMKYLNVSFIAEGCPVSGNFDLHFNKFTLKKQKDKHTLLLSCPDHKFGFFADGQCRPYSKEVEK